jgi:glycosyltransferase involved in cell wall biosynthesis
MRILLMADISPDTNSGAAGTEYQTMQGLRRYGHEVDELWSDDLPHKIEHGNLHYLLELPRAYRDAMKERLKRKQYDVVHVNQPHGYLAAKALSQSKSPSVFIHRSHGFELRVAADLKPWLQKFDEDGRALPRRLASKAMAQALYHNCHSIARYADGHIVSASQCGEFLSEQMGVPLERIAVIPQAAAHSFLERPASAMTPERLNHILYVGQFAFFKAPMIVAETMNRLSRADEKIQFTWVCSQEHHTQVRELLTGDARDRVRLLDWMPQEELMRVYDSHGIFLFPSFFEGFGKVFLEAMSRGLCVIAADNSGAHDVIVNHVNGILTPTGSIEAMTQACLGLLTDHGAAARLSTAAADTSRSYSWDRVARETVAFYESRLEAKARLTRY